MNFAKLNIQGMKPYSPPLDGRRKFNGILLDFNERTIPPSPKVRNALINFVQNGDLQIYPEYNDLQKRIAEYAGVKSGQIMLTSGSDQGIDLIFRTFTKADDQVIIPSPSFAMFYQCAEIAGNTIIKPEYKSDGNFPLEEVLQSITPKIKLIVICNPNNPTGTLILPDVIEIIAKKAPKSIIYIDEAYYEFSGVTAVSLVKKYPNIVITRTFSKAFGLSSLRIAYAIASPSNIQEMMKIRGPYDVNFLACIAAKASLNDLAGLKKYVNEVMNEAKPMVEKFFRKKKIEFIKSGSNFILFKSKNKKIFKSLKKQGILLRPQKDGQLRLTIGTKNQMKKFINAYNNL
ncbi:histidinol-phosphate transaminase [Patescibacteria group bacterium]|nr:histidinol-phosphate transaminase [Patescibacteria group bacterium]MBU1934512.1 histidinol-phosphate transaminase [Patescibacteria group bacterium]